MVLLKQLTLILIGFGSGLVISGAVFAFITIVGVVPRLAQKTKTTKYIILYEEAIIFGGIFGVSTMLFHYYLPIGSVLVGFLSFCIGIFYGSLAISLAEILDVIPILTRRARLRQGMFYFILSLAIGKLAGSLLYYMYPGFYYLGQ